MSKETLNDVEKRYADDVLKSSGVQQRVERTAPPEEEYWKNLNSILTNKTSPKTKTPTSNLSAKETSNLSSEQDPKTKREGGRDG